MYNRLFSTTIFLFLFLTLPLSAVWGQMTDLSRSRQEPAATFSQRLWYGGGFNLGFSGGGYTSLFQFGLSPMVGYKIFEPFSIGPRVSFTYNHYRARITSDRVATANPMSYSFGAFSRFKIIPIIFAQVELEIENEPVISIGSNDLSVSRREQNNLYIGGGYTSSRGPGSWGYELVLLFNLNQTESQDFIEPPYVIRVGLTRNF